MSPPRDPRAGPRLGGEFRDPEKDYSLQYSREVFLEQLVEVAPRVYEELVEEVYPKFQEAREATKKLTEEEAREEAAERSRKASIYGPRKEGKPLPPSTREDLLPAWIEWSFERDDWMAISVQEAPELVALRDAILGWVRKYRWLEAGWFLDAALDTLASIDGGQELGRFQPPRFSASSSAPPFIFEPPGSPSAEERRRALLDALPDPGDPLLEHDVRRAARAHFRRRPFFEHPGWHPEWKTADLYRTEVVHAFLNPPPLMTNTRGAAEDSAERDEDAIKEQRERLLPALKRALTAYMDQRISWARAAGLEPSPRKNARFDTDDEGVRAFRRLARYCAGESPSIIATEETVTPSAIKASNRATAALLGLPV